jgi:hypothetical protein
MHVPALQIQQPVISTEPFHQYQIPAEPYLPRRRPHPRLSKYNSYTMPMTKVFASITANFGSELRPKFVERQRDSLGYQIEAALDVPSRHQWLPSRQNCFRRILRKLAMI